MILYQSGFPPHIGVHTQKESLIILKWIKRHRPLTALLIIFLYLVLRAAAPFYHYKPVSQITKENTSVADFYQDGPGCDRAMILEMDQSAWDEWMRLMGMAREWIILSTFDFRDGESPRGIMSLTFYKTDEGVKVQILVDGFSGLVRMEGNNYFYALPSHPNIEIKIYNEINLLQPWTTQGRMHDKYVVADDYGYILGGRNTFDYFISSYPTNSCNHDREVLVYNTAHGTEDSAKSSLCQVEEYFNQVWNLEVSSLSYDSETLGERTSVKNAAAVLGERYDSLASVHPELFAPDNEDDLAILEGPDPLTYYQTHTVPAGKITLVSSPITIYAEEPMAFYTLTQLMKQAKERVVIHTPYATFNSTMHEAMLEVTKQVPVTTMVNSVENGDSFSASSSYPLHKEKFINIGMEILEYDGGFSYYGKSLVIDDEPCAIGPYNFDLRSTYMDTELMLVTQSPPLTAQLKEYMDFYQQDCRTLQSDDTYRILAHVNVASAPLCKRTAWKVVGFVMQLFRFLV